MMPLCEHCEHLGKLHNWTVRRFWGHCMYPNCDCTKYIPDTDKPKPFNRYIGRMTYKRH